MQPRDLYGRRYDKPRHTVDANAYRAITLEGLAEVTRVSAPESV